MLFHSFHGSEVNHFIWFSAQYLPRQSQGIPGFIFTLENTREGRPPKFPQIVAEFVFSDSTTGVLLSCLLVASDSSQHPEASIRPLPHGFLHTVAVCSFKHLSGGAHSLSRAHLIRSSPPRIILLLLTQSHLI